MRTHGVNGHGRGDVPTFEAEGYVWQDAEIVPCNYLHNLPDGDSVPTGRGTPLLATLLIRKQGGVLFCRVMVFDSHYENARGN